MKKVRISEKEEQLTRIVLEATDDNDDDDMEEDFVMNGEEMYAQLSNSQRLQSRAADRLSCRLLAIDEDDDEAQDEILRKSLRLLDAMEDDERGEGEGMGLMGPPRRPTGAYRTMLDEVSKDVEEQARRRICTMLALALFGVAAVLAALWVGVEFVGPPNQPVGPYRLIERQEGDSFFEYYSFYEGRDSVGSNGYLTYVSADRAQKIGIFNVSMEKDVLDVYRDNEPRSQHRRRTTGQDTSNETQKEELLKEEAELASKSNKMEPFVYMLSAPTDAGPRESIRLEGIRRFNRGLFIIDVRHMPVGCGVWPAFWLTDEANWPVNGEIDIVEGVNYQSEAKTALHSTHGCMMDDIPLGTMSGTWDTAQGIPDKKTGIPDMTLRYAQNCFVYDPHQWLNQGCVAVDSKGGGTLGIPVNDRGGGVYALEWDPINRHIRTWVFTPHAAVPDNLVDAIRTAGAAADEDRVLPDPDSWPIPYGYFAIGEGTNCPASHFRNMRIVFNTAFCGSVCGNRYQLDCPKQAKNYSTCNEWIKSNPDELKEAYWKVRGVYVYERQWERTWIA